MMTSLASDLDFEKCYARTHDIRATPATLEPMACNVFDDSFGPAGQELVHYATKNAFNAACRSSSFVEIDDEFWLSIIDDFKKEHPERYNILLQELTQNDPVGRRATPNLIQRILAAILAMVYMSFTAAPSLSAPVICSGHATYAAYAGFSEHESIAVGNVGPSESAVQLTQSIDEDALKWQDYINRLKGPPKKLTEEQLVKVHEIHAFAIDKNMGNPHADILTDEDDKKFFRLFWKPENIHHLEVDIYENGYVDWFYMNMGSKHDDCADGYDNEEKSLNALFSIIGKLA